MATGAAPGSQPRRLSPALRERETVKPLELYFDLVFVLGVHAVHGADVGESDLGGGRARACSCSRCCGGPGRATRGSRVSSIPRRARSGSRSSWRWRGCSSRRCASQRRSAARALAFAIAYGVVRVAHIGAVRAREPRRPDAAAVGARSRDQHARSPSGCWSARRSSTALAQGGLWVLAIAVDLGGPRCSASPGGGSSPAHFAERHNLVIILALGESIVALGIGAEVDLNAGDHRRGRPGNRARLGGVVDLLRRRRAGHRAAPEREPRRGASATRSPATPTRTCTSRWSPGSCSSPSASSTRSRTSTIRSTASTGSRCSAGSRSICSRTSRYGSATRVRSTVQRLAARPSCCSGCARST